MGSYEEISIEPEPLSISVHKRPGMYFLNLDDGTGYAIVVSNLIETLLSWKVGANVTLTLMPDRVEVFCRASLPKGENLWTCNPRRPFFVLDEGKANLGSSWFSSPLHTDSIVCQNAIWELRDGGDEQSAVFHEGVCRSAQFAAPDLPESYCFRVSLSIGTQKLPFTAATLDQVVGRIRYMGGPAEAGYWGCVTLRDKRTGETKILVVTDYPPRRNGRLT